MLGFIIQARTQSTRLPQKIMLPFYNEVCLLEILITRIQKHFSDYPIIIATSTNVEDNVIEELGQKLGVIVFRGDEHNVLKRFHEAALINNITSIIRICSDNPFLNMGFLDQLIKSATNSEHDYISFQLNNGTPVIKSHWGIFGEFIQTESLAKTLDLTKNVLYLEHVTNYIYTHQDIFSVKLLPLPLLLGNKYDIRLTLDTPSDFQLYKKMYKQLGEQGSQSVDNLLSYIQQSTEAKEIMSQQIKKYEK